MEKISYSYTLANSIYKDLDDLNRRKTWSNYYMEDLLIYINMVHNHLETLIEWRDNDEHIEQDEWNKIEQYIEIASNLERDINIAIVKLRCGDDVYIDLEY